MLHVVRREPKTFGIEGTRWTLAKIHEVCDWLRTTTPAGLSRLLDRLRIHWKRGRDHIHSPDPDYLAKEAEIAHFIDRRVTRAPSEVTLYLDEITYYRQPTVAMNYAAAGHQQPLAERSHRSNTPTRLVGALDVADGRVHFRQGSKIGIAELVAFFRQIHQAYPQAKRIRIILDNWPVHFHPDVLVALEPQESCWPRYLPKHWATEPTTAAIKRWGSLQLPIQLIPLPTYASWLNPIEKLWRKLRQDELHLHRLADRLDELRATVRRFLEQFADGSLALLHYVGLLLD